MTPDSSRFWPADGYQPGKPQPSFDKQPLRDWLDVERHAGRWNGDAPAPKLPPEVVEATSKRYLEAYRRLTGDRSVILSARHFMARHLLSRRHGVHALTTGQRGGRVTPSSRRRLSR